MANTSMQTHHQPHSHYDSNQHTDRQAEVPPSLVSTRLLYLHNASTSLRSSTSTVGIGGNHPPRGLEELTRFLLHLTSQAGRGTLAAPAVQEAVRLGRQLWGLEELTHTAHLTGLLALRSPCVLSRAIVARVATVWAQWPQHRHVPCSRTLQLSRPALHRGHHARHHATAAEVSSFLDQFVRGGWRPPPAMHRQTNQLKS